MERLAGPGRGAGLPEHLRLDEGYADQPDELHELGIVPDLAAIPKRRRVIANAPKARSKSRKSRSRPRNPPDYPRHAHHERFRPRDRRHARHRRRLIDVGGEDAVAPAELEPTVRPRRGRRVLIADQRLCRSLDQPTVTSEVIGRADYKIPLPVTIASNEEPGQSFQALPAIPEPPEPEPPHDDLFDYHKKAASQIIASFKVYPCEQLSRPTTAGPAGLLAELRRNIWGQAGPHLRAARTSPRRHLSTLHRTLGQPSTTVRGSMVLMSRVDRKGTSRVRSRRDAPRIKRRLY